jgi:hypothetical protein
VLFFGGITIAFHVFLDVFVYHRSLASSLTLQPVGEKLFGGLGWGAIMWGISFKYSAAPKVDDSKKEDLTK